MSGGRNRPPLILVACGLLGLFALLMGELTAFGGFSGSVTGSGSTFQSATVLLSDSINSSACLSNGTDAAASIGTDETYCSTSPVSSTLGTSVTTTVTSQGSGTNADAVASGTCGVQQFQDSASSTFAEAVNGNTGTGSAGVAHGAAGPPQFSDSPVAASFNGTTGHVTTATSFTSSTVFSMSLWFQTSTTGEALAGLTSTQAATTPATYEDGLWIDSAGAVDFGVTTGAVLRSTATTGRSFADGLWHQATATVSGTSIALFVDGVLVASNSADGVTPPTNPSYAHLGWMYTSGWTDAPASNFLNGQLADVIIVPSALTASQVTTLADATSQANEVADMTAVAPSYEWQMQDLGPDRALAYGGVTYGAAGPTALTDSPKAATFNGSTGYVQPTASLTSPQTFSLSGWFKTSSTNVSILGMSNTSYAATSTSFDRALWIDSAGDLRFGIHPSSGYVELTSPSAYNNGNWHFFVVTATATSATVGSISLYVDGASVASNSAVTIASSQISASYTGYWHLGWEYMSSSYTSYPTNNYFTGSLADVAYYPSVLSSGAVSTLYGETTQAALANQILADAPTSVWSLQDSGTTLYTGAITGVTANSAATTYRDASQNPGTDTGTGSGAITTSTSGPLGADAQVFNGSSTYITTASSVTPANSFTVAAWIKTTGTSESILGFTNLSTTATPTSYDRSIWIDASGHVDVGIHPSSGYVELSSPLTYNNGSWHYVVATAQATSATVGTLTLYVDGAQVAQNAAVAITASAMGNTAAGYWHLGWDYSTTTFANNPSSLYFNGSLGQVEVYPSALSSSQISSLYGANAFVANQESSFATLVQLGGASQYWPLDEPMTAESPACTYLMITVSNGTSCLWPYATTTCVTSSTTARSDTVAPTAFSSGTLAMNTYVVGTVPAAGTNLHVSVPWTISATSGGFTATLLHASGYTLL